MKLYGVCSQQGPIFIVTELMKNGKHPLSVPHSVIIFSHSRCIAPILEEQARANTQDRCDT